MMIKLPDEETIALATLMLGMAEPIMQSAVRRHLFDRSDVEWFYDDVLSVVQKCVRSDLAKAEMKRRLDAVFERLTDPLLPMWGEGSCD